MAGKKTKTYKMVDGKLLQMNKRFFNLKMNQKDKNKGSRDMDSGRGDCKLLSQEEAATSETIRE